MSATLPDAAAQPAANPTTEPQPVVSLQGVRRRFGTVDALAGLDLVLPANRITVLFGPNGAGKTTAIRMITGALDAHAGSVRTFGSTLRSTVRRCGRGAGWCRPNRRSTTGSTVAPTWPTPPSSTGWAEVPRSRGDP